MNSYHEKTIITNGISIYTESFGQPENPAILLIAGATVSLLYWDKEFCERLAQQGFFVIRYDNRDVGKSMTGKPGSISYSVEDLADDAIHILDGYAIRQAAIMGISLGGLIAQIIAIKYPERVSSLALMSTGPWGTPDPNIPEMDQQIIDFQLKASAVNWDDEEATLKYMLESSRLMAGQKTVNYAKEEERIRADFHRSINYRSMFNHALLQGGEAYYDRLNEIKSPTLIIHGSDDKIWHFGHTDKLLSEIKNSELLKLDGTGHELHENDWDMIIERLSEFMD
ncbi:alpha/beta hydrolase [Sphingobacterium sp. CZ-UAM]|uniref:macrolide hydrolase EstT n=1 Tax=Sphingobacterium sp. CZ-UAM TaxID=1933868 RepID=UPI000987C933|nr:macrolide hydrolase EstT [Sphingobacterium sp. CZ-UAM]OOG18863.1 alpha/beta hydrolase [Sphingobacterium sp. CZ-UAM]